MIVFFPWINGFFSQCKSFSLLCEWELLLFHTSRCILHQDKWEACFFLSKAQTFSQIFLLPLLFLKFLFQRAMVRSKFECCRSNCKEVRCLGGPNIEVPEYRRNLGIEKGIFFPLVRIISLSWNPFSTLFWGHPIWALYHATVLHELLSNLFDRLCTVSQLGNRETA